MKLQSFHLREQGQVQRRVRQGSCPAGFTPRFPSLNPGSWITLTEVNPRAFVGLTGISPSILQLIETPNVFLRHRTLLLFEKHLHVGKRGRHGSRILQKCLTAFSGRNRAHLMGPHGSFGKCTFTKPLYSPRTVIAAAVRRQVFMSNMRSNLPPPLSPGGSLRTTLG